MEPVFEPPSKWVEEFYTDWNDGSASDEVGDEAYFVLINEDRDDFPELYGFYGISLHDDGDRIIGHVYETEADYNEALGKSIDDLEGEGE